MLIEMYNRFCVTVTSIFITSVLAWLGIIMYDHPDVLKGVASIFGFFLVCAIIRNGAEQIGELLETGNKNGK